MIYPQKLSSRTKDKLVTVLMISTILIILMLILINKLITPSVNWYSFVILGFTYIWVTVIYSIKKNTNIASHILLQMIAIFGVVLYIDKRLGFIGWSVYMGLPIILMVANITILILLVISYKKYNTYAIYQLIIFIINLFLVILLKTWLVDFKILSQISISVSLFSFIISLILSYKDFYKAIQCKFHM